MKPKANHIWLINGIPGSGKSTTARALAARFERSAHIEGDLIQDLIIAGRVSPGQLPQDEENRQIQLCVKHQCLLAHSFVEAGFIPVMDYVVVNRQRVAEYKSHLPGCTLHLVTLDPGVDTALQRDNDRPEKTVAHLWTHLHAVMQTGLNGLGLWVDNRTRTIEETIDAILAQQDISIV